MSQPSRTHSITSLIATAFLFASGSLLAAALPAGDSKIEPTVASVPEATEATETTENLTLTLRGVKNSKGNIVVMIFDNEAAYKAYDVYGTVGYGEVPAKKGTMNLNFPNLTAGPYAVFVFHDQNLDQDLNMDSYGYPQEGYGTSNAKSQYDELTFTEASVQATHVKVKMYYLQ